MVKKVCYRGQIIAKEGKESEEIFIIYRGTFEVSKIIIQNSSKPKQRNTGHQQLPSRNFNRARTPAVENQNSKAPQFNEIEKKKLEAG